MTTRRRFLGAAASTAMLPTLRAAAEDPAFRKAMEAVREAIPLAESDPDRPVYHFHPPANWTNDPNGTLYYRGWHHLFYQLNPFAARIGSQHWGHARSRDLVNWEHLPIAIWPSADRGETAIFSGGAVMAADGRPRVFYTSIGHPQPEQWMAAPKDDELLVWEKYAGNPVLTQAAHIAGPVAQWRDPFLFRKDGSTYMVCGGAHGGRAQVQLYRAAKPDLTEWKHLGPIFQGLDREVRNFECPNLFPLDGKWVLIVSPNRPCEYWIGDLDIGRMQFLPVSHGVLDPGSAYASNISVDDKGRTILWLWGRTNTPENRGWGSVITMPRILSIAEDGYLRQNPAPEFASLREQAQVFPGRSLDTPFLPDGVRTDCAEIEAVFSGSGTFRLELRRSADGKPGVSVEIERGYVTVGSARGYVGFTDRYNVRVFLDKRCLEVFVNDGTAAVFNWFQAGKEDLAIAVSAQHFAGRGPVGPGPGARSTPPRLESLTVRPMKTARFSLEHFHV